MQRCQRKPDFWSAEDAGRVFALEMAFYVAAESISGLGGGLMFDRLLMTTRDVSAVMFAVSACSAVRLPVLAPPLPVHSHRHGIATRVRGGLEATQYTLCEIKDVSRSHLIPPCSLIRITTMNSSTPIASRRC